MTPTPPPRQKTRRRSSVVPRSRGGGTSITRISPKEGPQNVQSAKSLVFSLQFPCLAGSPCTETLPGNTGFTGLFPVFAGPRATPLQKNFPAKFPAAGNSWLLFILPLSPRQGRERVYKCHF